MDPNPSVTIKLYQHSEPFLAVASVCVWWPDGGCDIRHATGVTPLHAVSNAVDQITEEFGPIPPELIKEIEIDIVK